MTLHHNNMR